MVTCASEEEMEELLSDYSFSSLPMDTERLRDEFQQSSTHLDDNVVSG
jgi:hypothetical protein